MGVEEEISLTLDAYSLAAFLFHRIISADLPRIQTHTMGKLPIFQFTEQAQSLIDTLIVLSVRIYNESHEKQVNIGEITDLINAQIVARTNSLARESVVEK